MEQLLDDVDLDFFQDDTDGAVMDTNDVPLTCTEGCSTESQDDMGTQSSEGQWGTRLRCIPITSFPAHLDMGRRLQRILSWRDPHPSKNLGPVVELFGCAFLLTHSAGLDMWSRLFMLARKELLFLEEMGQDLPSTDFHEKTAEVLTFVDTVESFVYRYYLHTPTSSAATHSTQTTPSAVDHLSTCIRLFLSNLCPLEEYVTEPVGALHPVLARNYTQESLLALHVHIRWGLLSLLSAGGSSMQDLLSNCLQQVLEELLCVGAAVFNSQEKKSVGGSASVLPYCYECVLELWLLVIRLCDEMAEEGTGKSFWKTLSQVMSLNTCKTGQGECAAGGPLSSVEAPLSAAFWWRMVDWVAQVYRYDLSGSLTPSVQGLHAEGWQLVHELLLPMSTRGDCSRDALSSSLASLERLSGLWNPNLDVVLLFWPAVKKTMCGSPLPKRGRHASSAEGLFTSPQQVVSFVTLLCDGKGTGASEDSLFIQYVALLCGALTKLSSSSGAWKRVDEVVLSTLKSEDLLQFSSVGLGNFILFHLSLAWVGDTEAVGDILLRRLSSLRPSQPSCQHSAHVWTGLLALLHLQLQKQAVMDPVVGGVGRLLAEFAVSCSSTTSHISGPLFGAVEVVMRGTLELYQLAALSVSGAHQTLFSEPLCQSVKCLVERGRLVGVLEWVRSMVGAIGQHCLRLKEGRGSAEEKIRIQECHVVLFRHLLPVVSTQAQSPLPPAPLLGCATELASLCSKHPEYGPVNGEGSTCLQLVVEEFAFNDSVAPSFCAEFLVHLLKGEGQEAWLSTEHAQLRVLHSWLRCLVQMHHPPGAAQPVQCLTHLPIVTRLLAGTSDVTAVRVHPLQLLRELASAINEEMIKSPSLAEKTAWFQRGAVLFGDLMKCMEPGLSGDFPPKAMEMCYKVSGCLVRNCPRVIYRRSESRCLLPRLVDQLLVPVSNPRRPAHSNTSTNVKRSLHHFIWGLLQLDPQRDEFIKRKIKQIFGKYFLAYCQQSQPTPLMKRTDNNPFLTLLAPYFEEQPSKEDVNGLLFLLELIAIQQLRTPQQQLSHLSPVLTFLHTVFSHVRNTEALARCTLVVFQSLLTCMRLCYLQPSTPEVHQISRLCLDNVKLLLVACNRSEGLVQNTELTCIMSDYVSSNISNNVMLVFKPIQALIPFACDLVSDFQPVAWGLVERAEMGRGQKDRFLREVYQSLVEAISLHQK